jgi:hypothetical protein
LLSPTEWLSIIGNARLKEPYLLIYEPQRRDAGKCEKCALGIAEKKKLKIVKISKNHVEPRWIDRAVYPLVNNFLALFANADFVVTNSFHGIAFCLTFEKQFACASQFGE